jgi:hypothetical protein
MLDVLVDVELVTQARIPHVLNEFSNDLETPLYLYCT